MRANLLNWVESRVNAPVAGVEPLLAEASNRRFYRVRLAEPLTGEREAPNSPNASVGEMHGLNHHTLIIMDSPPELERNDAFVAVQKLFSTHGLPVPPVFAKDSAHGFFLLGDLGDRHLEDVYGTPLEKAALASAIDHLARLQRIDPLEIPPYLESRFRDELQIFVEWFLGNLLNEPLPSPAADAFESLIANAIGQPQCLIHRDYHCRNLMLSSNGELGIVDFQDALIGPATYDLACLLWDCYHEFSDARRRRWQRYYQSISPFSFETGELSRALDLTGLQRQLKAVGIFARLQLRDRKSSHLRYIGPVLAAATRLCASHPETRQLGKWLAEINLRASNALEMPRHQKRSTDQTRTQ